MFAGPKNVQGRKVERNPPKCIAMTNQPYFPFAACVAHPFLLLSIEPEVWNKRNWTMVSHIPKYPRYHRPISLPSHFGLNREQEERMS